MNRKELSESLGDPFCLISPEGVPEGRNEGKDIYLWAGFDKNIEGKDEAGNECGAIWGRPKTQENPQAEELIPVYPDGTNEQGESCYILGFDKTTGIFWGRPKNPNNQNY